MVPVISMRYLPMILSPVRWCWLHRSCATGRNGISGVQQKHASIRQRGRPRAVPRIPARARVPLPVGICPLSLRPPVGSAGHHYPGSPCDCRRCARPLFGRGSHPTRHCRSEHDLTAASPPSHFQCQMASAFELCPASCKLASVTDHCHGSPVMRARCTIQSFHANAFCSVSKAHSQLCAAGQLCRWALCVCWPLTRAVPDIWLRCLPAPVSGSFIAPRSFSVCCPSFYPVICPLFCPTV